MDLNPATSLSNPTDLQPADMRSNATVTWRGDGFAVGSCKLKLNVTAENLVPEMQFVDRYL